MNSAVVKHSVVVRGHKTSVSLENEFWASLRQIAELNGTTRTSLLQQIDSDRGKSNLSSAIRIFVLEFFRSQAGNEPSPPPGGRSATPIAN